MKRGALSARGPRCFPADAVSALFWAGRRAIAARTLCYGPPWNTRESFWRRGTPAPQGTTPLRRHGHRLRPSGPFRLHHAQSRSWTNHGLNTLRGMPLFMGSHVRPPAFTVCGTFTRGRSLARSQVRALNLAVRKAQRIILAWPSARTAGDLPLLLLDSAPTVARRSPKRLSGPKSGNSQLSCSRTS